jgi:hypothetical protein
MKRITIHCRDDRLARWLWSRPVSAAERDSSISMWLHCVDADSWWLWPVVLGAKRAE